MNVTTTMVYPNLTTAIKLCNKTKITLKLLNSLKMDIRNEEFYTQDKQREENEEEAPEW